MAKLVKSSDEKSTERKITIYIVNGENYNCYFIIKWVLFYNKLLTLKYQLIKETF